MDSDSTECNLSSVVSTCQTVRKKIAAAEEAALRRRRANEAAERHLDTAKENLETLRLDLEEKRRRMESVARDVENDDCEFIEIGDHYDAKAMAKKNLEEGIGDKKKEAREQLAASRHRHDDIYNGFLSLQDLNIRDDGDTKEKQQTDPDCEALRKEVEELQHHLEDDDTAGDTNGLLEEMERKIKETEQAMLKASHDRTDLKLKIDDCKMKFMSL